MISILFLSLLPLALATVIQAPAPFGRGQSISPADRIYTTDQTSNTITVISPYNRTTLGTLSLGDTRLSDVLGPQYLRAINVHGLGFSRDGKYITAITVASNTVTVIRTVDNTVISNTSVARAPHEAFFTPDGRYVWVGCRATSVVDIVDQFTDGGKVVGSIQTQPGPSKVLFSPDGALAYVNHISSASIAIIAVQNRTVIDTIFGLGDIFSSDMMISADGKRLWAVHKLVGKMSVVDLVRRKVVVVLDTGVESNHPNFFETAQGSTLGYVTVAAENAIKVYRQDREDETPVFVRAVNMTGTEPHGTWGSPDNSMIYAVNEHSDTVDFIDTETLTVVHTVPVGQESQALVYVANAVPSGSGLQNLGTQGLGLAVENRHIDVAGGGSVLLTVRELPGLEMVQIIAHGLKKNTTYTVFADTVRGNVTVPLLDFVPTLVEASCVGAPQTLAFVKFFGVYRLESVKIEEV